MAAVILREASLVLRPAPPRCRARCPQLLFALAMLGVGIWPAARARTARGGRGPRQQYDEAGI
jgi:hypothetical protein